MARLREQTIRFAIRNELAALSVARDSLERFGVNHGIPHKSLVQLQVALDEIVSNIIKYAWPEGGAHELSVRITAHSNRVEVEVVDDGQAFDPLTAKRPKRAAPGARPRPGGVGIHIVKQLIDNVEYVRHHGRNRITLTKRCAVGALQED
jgi:anti-sigma regulatory factor (Ser/Thr protein kinase)